jgi:hypothetical protein
VYENHRKWLFSKSYGQNAVSELLPIKQGLKLHRAEVQKHGSTEATSDTISIWIETTAKS